MIYLLGGLVTALILAKAICLISFLVFLAARSYASRLLLIYIYIRSFLS